jgi:hypothetical protein
MLPVHAQQPPPHLCTSVDLVIILATDANQPAGVQRLKVPEGAVICTCGVCCSLLRLCLLKGDGRQQWAAQHQVAGLKAVNHHLTSSSSSSSSSSSNSPSFMPQLMSSLGEMLMPGNRHSECADLYTQLEKRLMTCHVKPWRLHRLVSKNVKHAGC